MPTGPLAIDVHPQRHRVVVVARGELDHFTAPLLRAAVDELVASGWRDVVLDLRPPSFLDAGGVHLLVALAEQDDGPARFSMYDGKPDVALPLQLLGHLRVLPRADDPPV